MARRLILVHGYMGSPQENWFPWLKLKAEQLGFVVDVPAMPDANNPDPNAWLETLRKTVGVANKETYLIGHSLGCATILRYAEQLPADQKIGGAILVACFAAPLKLSAVNHFVDTPWGFERIKQHIQKITVINSDNDPYIPLSLARKMPARFGAKLIIMHNAGHISQSAGFTQLPEAIEELKALARL